MNDESAFNSVVLVCFTLLVSVCFVGYLFFEKPIQQEPDPFENICIEFFYYDGYLYYNNTLDRDGILHKFYIMAETEKRMSNTTFYVKMSDRCI